MTSVPSTVTVPDVWPVVPVIAVNRHPVFPKFIKIIEVNDRNMMEIVRRKVKLNQPYCGIFVKKNDENTDEVVQDMDELYPTGTFAQIVELQDLGSRLRMVLMAHRRIKLKEHVKELPVPPRVPKEGDTPALIKMEPPPDPEVISVADETMGNNGDRVFLAETENVKHDPFETSEEVREQNC